MPSRSLTSSPMRVVAGRSPTSVRQCPQAHANAAHAALVSLTMVGHERVLRTVLGVLAEQLLFVVGLLAGGNALCGSCRVPKAVEK